MLDLKIKKINVEILIVVFIFLLSCLNSLGLYISMILSLLYLFQGKLGLIKLMFLYILRTNISPGLFYDISLVNSFQFFKWIIIFGGSILLVLNSKRTDKLPLLLTILTFTAYLFISSIITTSNINLAIFKIINYIFPLIAFFMNIETLKLQKLTDWIYKLLQLSVMISLPLYFTSVGFLRNGHGFQGMFNNPNMFGIILVLSYAMLITVNKNFKIVMPFTALYTILIITTESRTSLISFVCLIILYLLITKMNNNIKVVILASLSVLFLLIIMNFKAVVYNEVLVKGDNEDVLNSRRGQIESFEYGIKQHPILGNGFGVPLQKSTVIQNDSTIVEAGNLIMAITIYSGVIGLLILTVLILIWFKEIDKKYIFLFLSTIMINMGEMVLFSSNSLGLWCSLFWIISLKHYPTNNLEGEEI